MLHGYTIIAVTQEQAINTLAETVESTDRLDMGSGIATMAHHPVHGDMIIINNAVGESIIALRREQQGAFTD